MSRRRSSVGKRIAAAFVIAACLPIVPATASPASASTPTPVASWAFNEGSGSTAHDAVGNRHGTLSSGVGWTSTDPFEPSAALSLADGGGRVAIANGPALEPADYITVSVWFRSTASMGGVLAEKGDAGCDVGTWRLTEWGGHVSFQWRMVGGFVGTVEGPWDTVNDGAWHHAVAELSAASATATVYVDGRVGGLVYTSGSVIDYDYAGLATDSLLVGSSDTCGLPYDTPSADVDDLRLYDVKVPDSDLWAMEPPYATTVTASVHPAAPFAAETLSFEAIIRPLPTMTQVTFHYTRDGGVEQTITGMSLSNDGHPGWTFYQGFPAGHYVMTAEFPGFGPAQPSTSDPVEFTVSKRETVTTMAAPGSQPLLPGEGFVLNPSTTWVVPQAGGTPSAPFTLFDVSGPDPVQVSTFGGCSIASINGKCIGILNAPGREVGTYRYQARFDGDVGDAASMSPEVEVVVAKRAPVVTIEASPNPVQAHQTAYLTAQFWAPGVGNQPTDGVLLIRDLATGDVLATGNAGEATLQMPVTFAAVGSHQYAAEWSGNDQFTSGSGNTTLQIVADIVEATGVGLSATTFYPVVDGYRDTVLARGTRAEPISVAISVKNSGGTTVRRATIGAATGSYSWAWNGKNTAGTLLPAGTYRVVQTLKDAAGMTKTVTSSIVLSRKKLYWYTKDLYKTSSQYQKRTSSWGAWLFTMPSAKAYRSMRLYAYGSEGMAAGRYGAQDFRMCSWSAISPSCASHSASLPFSLRWVSTPLSSTYDRHGRYVRAYAWAEIGQIRVSRLRLHLQYGILK